MIKAVKFALAATVVAALVACGGGGGDDAPAVPLVNLSPLVGFDNSVSGTFSNSCTGSGVDVALWQATATDDTLNLTVKDRSSSDALQFTLKYISGDNDTGYVFSGTVKDIATGRVASIESTLLKNNSTTGGLNITGLINGTDRGCAVRILLA